MISAWRLRIAALIRRRHSGSLTRTPIAMWYSIRAVPGSLFSGLTGKTVPGFMALGFTQNPAHTGDISVAVSFGTAEIIPEPRTLGMLGTGLIGLAGIARRKLKL